MLDSDVLRRLKTFDRRIRRAETKAPALPEQSTWTPVIEGSVTAGAGTYTIQAGTWTRIGNRALYTCTVTWTAHTGTGQMRIAGLAHTAAAREAVTLWTSAVTFAGAAPQARVPIANYAELSYPVSNAVPTVINIEAAGTITATWSMEV